MSNRTAPYSSYNYLISLGGTPVGGFTEMSKVQGSHKVNDVTLKRGVIDSTSLWNWINSAKSSGSNAKQLVTIILRNEANQPIEIYKLAQATPKKYAGPSLTGKGIDVAIEELVLACENIVLEKPPQ